MFGKAAAELKSSVFAWRMWSFMGYQDIQQRYRNSILGPLWLVCNLGVVVLGIGLLYPKLFKTDLHTFVPFVTVSLMIWNFFIGTLTEGCSAFLAASGIVRQIKIPLPVFVLRVIWRNIIMLAHSMIVFAIVGVIFKLFMKIHYLEFVGGTVLFLLNLTWMVMILAILSTRFRDTAQIVLYVLIFSTFMTPIYWPSSLLPANSPFLVFNPLAHYMAIIRDPLLGNHPTALNWSFCIGTAILGWAVAYVSFAWKRREIIFWF